MRMKFLVHTIGEREQAASSTVDTDIPARLDRLPWRGFHTLVVAALGITWILDGLERHRVNAGWKELSPAFDSKDLVWTDALPRVVVCWRPSSRISPGPVPRIDKLWS